MQKFVKLFSFITILLLLLSACGTTENPSESNNGSDSSGQVNQVEEQKEDDGISEETDEPKEIEEADDQKQSDSDEERTDSKSEQSIEYTVNGETHEEIANLKSSDNQNYSMFVLPEYELTAEEPNKDIVFLSDDGEISMRIELLPTDADWDSAINTAKSQLAVVNSEVKSIEAPNDEFFKDVTAFEASSDQDVVKAYLIKNDSLSLKLTLFMKSDQDHTDPFLKMAKTIVKN